MKEDIERRRMEAAEKRMKRFSISSTEGDESFNPLSPKSPTFKVNNSSSMGTPNFLYVLFICTVNLIWKWN